MLTRRPAELLRRPALAADAGDVAAVPRLIGFLNSNAPGEWAPFVDFFRAGLAATGYVEDRNVAIEFRWALGDMQKVPTLARDLVGRRPDVIVASGALFTTLAAMQATSSIPIVAVFTRDPVGLGWIQTLAHPGGNVSGVALYSDELEGKRLEILRDVLPHVTTVTLLQDRLSTYTDTRTDKVAAAARALGLRIVMQTPDNDAALERAFAEAGSSGSAMIVASTAYLLGRRNRLASLALQNRVPALFSARAYVDAGGLLGYGIDREMLYRELGTYAGLVLSGAAKPAELPVWQPNRFDLSINLKTAAALGLVIPDAIRRRADALVE